MKKIFLVLALLTMTTLTASAETVKARVGNIRAKINTNNENNTVSLSQAGDKLTIGFGYSKTKIAGLNTQSTTISVTLQFAIEGELAAGETYSFDSTSVTPIVTAVKTNVKKTIGYSTTGNSSTPVASGTFKVTSYDSTTGEIKGTLKATVSPIQLQKNTNVRELSKGVRIQANINGILD